MATTKPKMNYILDGITKDEKYEDLLYGGCTYENLEDVLQTGVLGFCGCGDASDNLLHIMTVLSLLESRSEGERSEYMEWYAKLKAYFGTETHAQFFYYWLDERGFTEHGGSVFGSWLTPKGKDLLRALEKWKDEEYEVEEA